MISVVNYFWWKISVKHFHNSNCDHMKIRQPSFFDIRIAKTSRSICQKQVNTRWIFGIFKAGWLLR